MSAKAKGKVVVAVGVLDQADLLTDFIAWYRRLGVDHILIQDFGSRDGTADILVQASSEGELTWFTDHEYDRNRYTPADALAFRARDANAADWIIQCDADEFLTIDDRQLNDALVEADECDASVIRVPCHNMTGPIPLIDQRATAILTLRIDRPYRETEEQQLSGLLPNPFIFVRHPPHTIVRASTFERFLDGAHDAEACIGGNIEMPDVKFLHYPMRAYEKFAEKIRNVGAWLDANPHLSPTWGWHWRRWVKLMHQGRLREEYVSQFVSQSRARWLLRNSICSVDESVSDFVVKTRS